MTSPSQNDDKLSPPLAIEIPTAQSRASISVAIDEHAPHRHGTEIVLALQKHGLTVYEVHRDANEGHV